MFTGIVEEIGSIKAITQDRIVISARKVLEATALGDSISVNGVCLTVTAIDASSFSVEIMPETLRRTNLGTLHPGDAVNLERALAVGSRLGGHFVQGHVDSTGKIISLTPEGRAVLLKVSSPPAISRYCVEKGFIAVDGMSLTITRCDCESFTVSLVGYTQQHTTFGHKRPGDPVNLEVDILAKYIEKLANPGSSPITAEFLTQNGFT